MRSSSIRSLRTFMKKLLQEDARREAAPEHAARRMYSGQWQRVQRDRGTSVVSVSMVRARAAMIARTVPPGGDSEGAIEDLVAEPRMIFLFSLKAAINLRGRRPPRLPTRHTDADPLRMERRSDLHSTRNRSLEGRRESLYYAPSAREGSIKTQRVMSYQTRGRVTKPCFSNCTIRGTGPSARPRKNAGRRLRRM